MQPAYIGYYSYLLIGIVALVALAYAIPGRMRTLHPSAFAQLQNPPAGAPRSFARNVILETGDSRLRLYLWLQQTGFYIWAAGGIAFTIMLFILG